MKVLIVGGVAGGATAAARIRRLDESAEIVGYEGVDKRIDVLATSMALGTSPWTSCGSGFRNWRGESPSM